MKFVDMLFVVGWVMIEIIRFCFLLNSFSVEFVFVICIRFKIFFCICVLLEVVKMMNGIFFFFVFLIVSVIFLLIIDFMLFIWNVEFMIVIMVGNLLMVFFLVIIVLFSDVFLWFFLIFFKYFGKLSGFLDIIFWLNFLNEFLFRRFLMCCFVFIGKWCL